MANPEMTMDDLILVSVDDHVNEPADIFQRHIAPKFKDRAPKVVLTQHGQAWEIEGVRSGGLGLNAVVGRPKTEYGFEPTSYDQMRPGTYDIEARIDDMNVNGVLGSICFPQFPGFAGARFLRMQDKELALATIQAYNDWHIHDWCGPYPERFIPLALLPLWDIDLTMAELKRVHALGVHAISFSDNPALLGLPSIHSEVWEPLWKFCADNQVVICCHIGTGAAAAHASDESPIGSWITAMPISISNSAADWLFASFWKRYPTLKMALSEGGIGWIPYFLERADFTVQQHGAWTNLDLGMKPSELFRKHFITCFIEDEFGLHNLDYIGEDLVTWECDYPHSDCGWPNSPEIVWKGLQHLKKSTIDKVTHLNTMREFSYQPFEKMGGAKNCTVGALRAKAKNVDTSEKGFLGGLNPRFDPNRPVTSGDIKKILTTI